MTKIFFFVFTLFIFFSAQNFASERAPSFSLKDTEGELVRLDDFIANKVVLLDFWSTWCKPCRKSMPKLEKLYQEFKDKGFVVIGINEDGPRSLSKVQPFAHSMGLTYPILLDENREVARKYKIAGFPTAILIKAGEIVLRVNGYRPGDENHLREKIASLLTGEISKS